MIVAGIVLYLLSSFTFKSIHKSHRCEFPYINYSNEDLKIRESWDKEKFSQIMEHDPKNFIYLIHKIDKTHRFLEKIPRDSWTYKILERPEVLTGALLISGSVITHEHLASAFSPESRIGFVLSQDCHLIGPSFHKDMFSKRPNSLEEAQGSWEELFKKFPQSQTPLSIATALKGSNYYNEVTMIGTDPVDGMRKVKVEALLIECPQEKIHLHKGTAVLWKGNEEEIRECLEGYIPKEQVYPMLLKLAKRYPVLLKAALKDHDYGLFEKINSSQP